jgi:hypothetical protein
VTNNPKFYKKVINNGLFQNRELMTNEKKQSIMEKIYLERNKDVVKKKRLKDAIGIAVCFCLLFFTGQYVWNQINNNNNQSITTGQSDINEQAFDVIKHIPANEGELTGEDWLQLNDHDKYNLIGDVLKAAGIKSVERQEYLRLLKTQLDRGLQFKEHKDTGVNSAILYLFNKYKYENKEER